MTELDRIEAMVLKVNKRLNAIEYRFKMLEEAIPQLQEAALELSAALAALRGEDTPPKEEKDSS